ncbi:FAD-dependent oxidoreductase [Myxococcota bacterium]|nr:FAD-dependent oxidoreductase [Myxococcota bacterium]
MLDDLRRSFRLALDCERRGISTEEGLAQRTELEERLHDRRRFLKQLGAAAAAGGVAHLAAACGGLDPSATSGTETAAVRRTPSRVTNVAIVGAGLAGLQCALDLRRAGVTANVYEASDRVGGRQWSLRNHFPGQVAERGGELIDNLHKTMLGYVQRYNLTTEDLSKEPGAVTYYFGGQYHPEAVIVDQYRTFVTAMRADNRRLSGEVSADNHTAFDVQIDNTSLRAYLEGANGAGLAAGAVLKEAIIQAYVAEYGIAAEEQSAVNFLHFIHADRRSKFTPFGVFSDERYHVLEGNDAIAQGIAAELSPAQLAFGHRLVRVAKTASGAVQLTFSTGGSSTVTRTHEAVVLALPFTVLRTIQLDASLGLPAWKRQAIDELGYGTNAKMMIGFDARPWAAIGSNGSAYADLANVQTTWESNPTRASATRAILTDYSGAARGANLDPSRVQREASRFLGDLDRVFPGALAAATRVGTSYRAHLEHWPSSPDALGSYTAYRVGQFTTIAGNEGKPVGNVLFAGEHTDSFYSWQGFMEGALLSGIRAAGEVLDL